MLNFYFRNARLRKWRHYNWKISIKLLCLYLVQHMLHQIKAKFYTDLGLYQKCKVLQKIEEFKGFSRLLSDFPVLFKADLIFKDFSRKPSKFKYFSSLWEPSSSTFEDRFSQPYPGLCKFWCIMTST